MTPGRGDYAHLARALQYRGTMHNFTMKFVGALAVLSAMGVTRAEAQVEVTLVAGPTFATTSRADAESKAGFFVAAGTALPLNETFAVEAYAGYAQKGVKFDAVDLTEDLSKNVLEIPVLLSAGFGLNESITLGLRAGPRISFDVSCQVDVVTVAGPDSFDCDSDPEYDSTEIGVIGGASIGFPLGESMTMSFGIAGDFGITALRDDGEDEKTRTYLLFAGLGIPLG